MWPFVQLQVNGGDFFSGHDKDQGEVLGLVETEDTDILVAVIALEVGGKVMVRKMPEPQTSS